jgi:hypothetical protein
MVLLLCACMTRERCQPTGQVCDCVSVVLCCAGSKALCCLEESFGSPAVQPALADSSWRVVVFWQCSVHSGVCPIFFWCGRTDTRDTDACPHTSTDVSRSSSVRRWCTARLFACTAAAAILSLQVSCSVGPASSAPVAQHTLDVQLGMQGGCGPKALGFGSFFPAHTCVSVDFASLVYRCAPVAVCTGGGNSGVVERHTVAAWAVPVP